MHICAAGALYTDLRKFRVSISAILKPLGGKRDTENFTAGVISNEIVCEGGVGVYRMRVSELPKFRDPAAPRAWISATHDSSVSHTSPLAFLCSNENCMYLVIEYFGTLHGRWDVMMPREVMQNGWSAFIPAGQLCSGEKRQESFSQTSIIL